MKPGNAGSNGPGSGPLSNRIVDGGKAEIHRIIHRRIHRRVWNNSPGQLDENLPLRAVSWTVKARAPSTRRDGGGAWSTGGARGLQRNDFSLETWNMGLIFMDRWNTMKLICCRILNGPM